MAKNDKDKGKEVAIKKESAEKEAGRVPARGLSPWHAWEREIERTFEDFPLLRWSRLRERDPFRFARELRLQAPTVDMYEEKGEIVVKAEMPGMSKDDIDIVLRDSTLTLKGEKKKEEETKEKDYYRCEREYGSFLRTIELPSEARSDGAKATFKNGVLEIRLRKSEQASAKEVHVPVQ